MTTTLHTPWGAMPDAHPQEDAFMPTAPYAARRFRPLVKDPLAWAKRIATDPDYRIDAPEGPVRVPEKEKEEV